MGRGGAAPRWGTKVQSALGPTTRVNHGCSGSATARSPGAVRQEAPRQRAPETSPGRRRGAGGVSRASWTLRPPPRRRPDPGTHSPGGRRGRAGVGPGAEARAIRMPAPPRAPGRAHSPCRGRGPEGARRGGGARACLRGRAPAASALPPDPHRGAPHSRGLIPPPARPPSAGAQPSRVPPRAPRPLARATRTPCFCFELSPPQGAGRVTPRGGIRRRRRDRLGKRVPQPVRSSPAGRPLPRPAPPPCRFQGERGSRRRRYSETEPDGRDRE